MEILTFLCRFNPRKLTKSFVDALAGLPTESGSRESLIVSEFETTVKSKPNQTFSTVNQRCCSEDSAIEMEGESIKREEQGSSTQFLQTQRHKGTNLFICSNLMEI